MGRRIRKVGRFLLYGGFRGLERYEREVLDATAAALPADEGEILRRQTAMVERVQRWNDHRVAILGFADKASVPRLGTEELDHCLARVRVRGSTGVVTARVMTHRGLLSSLEFRSSPRRLARRYVAVEVVETHAGGSPASERIDEEEHLRARAG